VSRPVKPKKKQPQFNTVGLSTGRITFNTTLARDYLRNIDTVRPWMVTNSEVADARAAQQPVTHSHYTNWLTVLNNNFANPIGSVDMHSFTSLIVIANNQQYSADTWCTMFNDYVNQICNRYDISVEFFNRMLAAKMEMFDALMDGEFGWGELVRDQFVYNGNFRCDETFLCYMIADFNASEPIPLTIDEWLQRYRVETGRIAEHYGSRFLFELKLEYWFRYFSGQTPPPAPPEEEDEELPYDDEDEEEDPDTNF
jgi:hypothetical protein